MVIRAKAVVDPRAAVAMFEALPPVSPDAGVLTNRWINQDRAGLITRLVEPVERTLEGRLATLGHPGQQGTIPLRLGSNSRNDP